MKTATVKIGGVDYEINAMPILPTREWQRRAKAPVDNLITAIEGAQSTQINDLQSLVALGREIVDIVMMSPDLLLDLVCAYAPNVAADRERIEKEGFYDEITAAFLEVLKQVYPLGQLISLLGRKNSTT